MRADAEENVELVRIEGRLTSKETGSPTFGLAHEY
jgi:hypothetical protein